MAPRRLHASRQWAPYAHRLIEASDHYDDHTPDPIYTMRDGRVHRPLALLDSVQTVAQVPFTGGGDLWSYTFATRVGQAPEWLVLLRRAGGFLLWMQGDGDSLLSLRRMDPRNTIGSWDNVDTTAAATAWKTGDGIFLVSAWSDRLRESLQDTSQGHP